MAHGLSVFRSYQAASRMRRRFKGFRSHAIVYATFDRPMGVLKQTGNPEHYTWWPDEEINLPALFQIDPAEAQ
jgi:hypothetical protein